MGTFFNDVCGFPGSGTQQNLSDIIINAPKAATNQMPGLFTQRIQGPDASGVFRHYDNRFLFKAL